ncbi:MAG: hypothetical protein ABI411_00390 [Tahibacter sp.]
MITQHLLAAMDGVTSSACGFVAAIGAIALTGSGDWVESGSMALALAIALPPIGFVCAALGASWLQQLHPACSEQITQMRRQRGFGTRTSQAVR